MIQALARAPKLLNSSTDLVRKYVMEKLGEDGGFQGRDNKSDLYYTVFGMELLIALNCTVPADLIKKYLDTFDNGHSLDLVHLSSLTRSYRNLADISPYSMDSGFKEGVIRRLNALRCSDGGFSTNQSDMHGNLYGCFLALAMYQDMDINVSDPEDVFNCIKRLETVDGGFANEQAGMISTTPSTAAALCSYHMLGYPLPQRAIEWLLNRASKNGGFCAFKSDRPLNMPDLLSTATALQALSYSNSINIERELHLDFLDSLWNPLGGFSGTWADPTVDCEYTYYGLLALGYLADIP
jgi:prenyltransferase beta subunit